VSNFQKVVTHKPNQPSRVGPPTKKGGSNKVWSTACKSGEKKETLRKRVSCYYEDGKGKIINWELERGGFVPTNNSGKTTSRKMDSTGRREELFCPVSSLQITQDGREGGQRRTYPKKDFNGILQNKEGLPTPKKTGKKRVIQAGVLEKKVENCGGIPPSYQFESKGSNRVTSNN